jgi:hypothetical protein
VQVSCCLRQTSYASQCADCCVPRLLGLLQDIWWHALATCISALAQKGQVHRPGLKHPCAKRLAAYSCPRYLPELLANEGKADLEAHTSFALHVLLMAELWDVWPWQLEQLQAATKAGSSSSGSGSGSSSSSSRGSSSRGNSSTSSGTDGCSSSSGGGGGRRRTE